MLFELPQHDEATAPVLRLGALVLDDSHRVLLVRSCRAGEAWGIPSRPAAPLEPAILTVVKLMHDEFGVLAWPAHVLTISEELDEELGRHDVWIVYSVSMLTRMPLLRSASTYDEVGWFARRALPARLTLATVDALRSL